MSDFIELLPRAQGPTTESELEPKPLSTPGVKDRVGVALPGNVVGPESRRAQRVVVNTQHLVSG